MARGRIGQQFQHRERGDGFSRTGLTDERNRLALPELERNAVDGQDLPLALTKGDGEIADGEKGLIHDVQCNHPNVLRGSKASRTASPMKISSESMNANVKKPVRPSQGAWIFALACESSSPSEGEPGGKPKPRKSSEVSVITEPDMTNGRNVMVATMALGRRWRNMMVRLETPSARAA